MYLCTGFLDGGTLADWAGSPRTWRQIANLLLGVADDLASAHPAGLMDPHDVRDV